MPKFLKYLLLILIGLPILAWFCFIAVSIMPNKFLTFSDAAKYADIGRNLMSGRGYGSLFNFFGSKLLTNSPSLFPASFAPPAMPLAEAGFFKMFGVTDVSVITTSLFFFILTIVGIYLLANKVYGKLVALLSSTAVACNLDYWAYAGMGASETLFSAEIVFIPYLILIKKWWADLGALFLLMIMYFTRPQAFIFIFSYILLWLLIKFNWKTTIKLLIVLTLGVIILDKIFVEKYSGDNFVYSLIGRGKSIIIQQSQSSAVSNSLRGASDHAVSILSIVKRTANNLFNFYRLVPNILSPYLFFLFILSLFFWDKDKDKNVFKTSSLLAVILSFLLPALTIPFFRYIHPAVPLIYIIGVNFLIVLCQKFAKKSNVLLPLSIVAIFVVILNLGTAIQNYRYDGARTNLGKPPVYEKLAEVLKENTNKNDFIITNLDTWGSWYGERKTMWFPLTPFQLIPPNGQTYTFDAIYLTSYLIDDENYYMGEDWRQIFNNPNNPEKWTCDGCAEIKHEFSLKGVYEISASDDYQRETARAILLTRKTAM